MNEEQLGEMSSKRGTHGRIHKKVYMRVQQVDKFGHSGYDVIGFVHVEVLLVQMFGYGMNDQVSEQFGREQNNVACGQSKKKHSGPVDCS